MRKNMIRIWALALSFILSAGLFPAAAFAGGGAPEETVFCAGTAEEFTAAVADINAADHGKFVIRLTGDITVGKDVSFEKNETVICGQGHELGLGSRILLKNADTRLGFGLADGTDSLTVSGQGKTRSTAMIGVNDGAVLDLFPGAVIRDTKGGGAAGAGVFVYGTFNMYGGKITGCYGSSIGIGGAVSLNAGVFNMSGGEISGNGASGYFGLGAGVLVYADRHRDCAFNMSGGVISGNENTGKYGWGGGVCLWKPAGESVTMNMSGGIIENNGANAGGGIFNLDGDLKTDGGVVRNNAAADCADDVLTQGGSCALADPSGFGTLSSTGRPIDGWYQDGLGDGTLRWNRPVDPEGKGLDLDGDGTAETTPDAEGGYDLDGDGVCEIKKDDPYICKLEDPAHITAAGALALKAAHSDAPVYTVTYTDGVDGEEIFADQVTGGLEAGAATPAFSGSATRPGYVFKGWDPEPAAAVSGDAVYTAKWAETYTVTYTDGVDGEEIFADQVTGGLEAGDATPAFVCGKTAKPSKFKVKKLVLSACNLKRPGYVFTGWSPVIAATVSGDAVYTAKWAKTYTVTYTDGVDGEEVFADQATGKLKAGDPTPAFTGSTARDGYVFKGWDPEPAAAVSADAVYTAKWAETYTVTYTDGADGEEVFADQVTGNLEAGDPTPAFAGSTARGGYVFRGWDPEPAAAVSGDAVYTAKWAETYTVTYTDGVDGEEIFADQTTKDLEAGDLTPKFSGSKTRDGYTFKYWKPIVVDWVSADAVYTAQWEKNSPSAPSVPKPGTKPKPGTEPATEPVTEPITEPATEPATESEQSKLPQSGQHWWSVWVMSVSGASLVAAGIAARRYNCGKYAFIKDENGK